MAFSRAICLFFCAAALLSADQITMKNGDRVTGKVVRKDGDSVTFKSDFFGEISLKWPDISSLTTDQTLTVELPGDKVVTGNVSASNGQITIEANTIPQTEVKAVRNAAEQAKFERYRHPPLTALWAGFFDFGLAASSGNSATSSYTTAFNATRATRTDSIRLNFAQLYARGRINGLTRTTADAARGGWAYDRNTHPKLFFNVFNNYEYDSFQNLDLRFTAGGGFGFHAVKREAMQLDLLGGADFNYEKFSIPGVVATPAGSQLTRRYAELYYGDDFSYKLSGRSSLKQSFRMFDNLNDLGQYRLSFDLGAETKLMKFLSWQVSFSDRFISNPPAGLRRNDLLLSTGVRLTFAR